MPNTVQVTGYKEVKKKKKRRPLLLESLVPDERLTHIKTNQQIKKTLSDRDERYK